MTVYHGIQGRRASTCIKDVKLMLELSQNLRKRREGRKSRRAVQFLIVLHHQTNLQLNWWESARMESSINHSSVSGVCSLKITVIQREHLPLTCDRGRKRWRWRWIVFRFRFRWRRKLFRWRRDRSGIDCFGWPARKRSLMHLLQLLQETQMFVSKDKERQCDENWKLMNRLYQCY